MSFKCNELNPAWKGDNVGYSALHAWVARKKTKPKYCESCQTEPPYDLSNISGEYKRDLSDWEWLCRRCHMKKEGRVPNKNRVWAEWQIVALKEHYSRKDEPLNMELLSKNISKTIEAIHCKANELGLTDLHRMKKPGRWLKKE